MYNPEKVLEDYRNAIFKVANTYYVENPRFSYEDLIAEAECAAIVACNSFEEDGDASFFTYLTSTMNREVQKFVRSNAYDINVRDYQHRKAFKNSGNVDKIKTSAIALHMDSEEDDSYSFHEIFASGSIAPDELAIKKESINILYEEIEKLPEREQKVIKLRKLEGLTLQEIATQMNATKQTVHGWEKRGFERLGKRVRTRLGHELY